MKISARGLATASLISAALLFFLATFLGSITVRTAQPNGLAQIEVPYGAIGFYGVIGSAGLLLFGIALLFASLKDNALERKRLLGSALLSGGILAILVGGFIYLVNWEDDGPRCLNGCRASLLRYYNEIYVGMSIMIVLWFAGSALGLTLLKRKYGAASMSRMPRMAISD